MQLGPGGAEKVEGLGRLNDYERESLEVRPSRRPLIATNGTSLAAATTETEENKKHGAGAPTRSS